MDRRYPQSKAQTLSKLGIPITTSTKKPQAKLVLPNMVDNCDKFYPPIQRNKHHRTEPAPYAPYSPPTPPASANSPCFPYYVHSKAEALISNPPAGIFSESNFIPPTTWGPSIMHKCAVGVVTAVLVGAPICENIFHGVSTVGGFIYANIETIQETCTTYMIVAVQSSYNAAKRRLVSIQTTHTGFPRRRSPATSLRLTARENRNRRFAWLYSNTKLSARGIAPISPNVITNSFNSLRLSGRRKSQRILEKPGKRCGLG